MIENVSGVFLRVFTKEGIFDFPFKDFEQLDKLTVQFVDEEDLIKNVFSGYAHLVNKIEINYVNRNIKSNIPQRIPFKFIGDNYDESDLKKKYFNYMRRHPSQAFLDKWKISHAIRNGRINSFRSQGDEINAVELEKALLGAWDKGYKTRRDIYFALKNVLVDVEIVPSMSFADRQLTLNEKIESMETSDQYVQYLQSSLKNDDDSRNFVMEQLLMFDLDKLMNMGAPFDGVSEWEKLDVLTEHSATLTPTKRKLLVSELEEIRNSFLKSYGKKKCRK